MKFPDPRGELNVEPYNKYQISNIGVFSSMASPPLLSVALPTVQTSGVNEQDCGISEKYLLVSQAGFRNVNVCRRIHASG